MGVNGMMNPAPLKDPPFMYDVEEGAPFSLIRPLRFREVKGTERVIAYPRLSFVCVAGLESYCILLIGEVARRLTRMQTVLHPILSIRRWPVGTPLAAWRDDGCHTRVPVGVPPSPSQV
jgi:hypothetical protein